jgi:hypothetical protein
LLSKPRITDPKIFSGCNYLDRYSKRSAPQWLCSGLQRLLKRRENSIKQKNVFFALEIELPERSLIPQQKSLQKRE